MSYREYFNIDPEYFPQVDKKLIEEKPDLWKNSGRIPPLYNCSRPWWMFWNGSRSCLCGWTVLTVPVNLMRYSL